MAIRMYHDSGGTNEVSSGNPDTVKQTIEINQDLIQIETFYLISDDSGLTYESVSIEKIGTSSFHPVYVDYATNLADFDSIGYGTQETLSLSNGDYVTAVPIHRRVVAESLTEAFNSVAEIYHRVERDEYAK